MVIRIFAVIWIVFWIYIIDHYRTLYYIKQPTPVQQTTVNPHNTYLIRPELESEIK